MDVAAIATFFEFEPPPLPPLIRFAGAGVLGSEELKNIVLRVVIV